MWQHVYLPRTMVLQESPSWGRRVRLWKTKGLTKKRPPKRSFGDSTIPQEQQGQEMVQNQTNNKGNQRPSSYCHQHILILFKVVCWKSKTWNFLGWQELLEGLQCLYIEVYIGYMHERKTGFFYRLLQSVKLDLSVSWEMRSI